MAAPKKQAGTDVVGFTVFQRLRNAALLKKNIRLTPDEATTLYGIAEIARRAREDDDRALGRAAPAAAPTDA